MKDNTRLLTTGDVARYCGASRMGVLRWIRQGRLKAYTTPGGHYRIRMADFRDFLERYDIPVDASLLREQPHGILIVTGDVSVLGTIVKGLTSMPEGYEIDVAIDGHSALAKITDFKPSLVILDGAATGIDAPELAQSLEAGPDGQSVPVLFLTTGATASDEEETTATGAAASALLQRTPLEIETLQETVRRLLAL
ncbi:MAG: helix-turn-helix domain-containing protein [Chloroflexi bacterium]|nr:MAG: helix-turn-helix domain-containing protein [Chloroflexota bacterium]